MKVSHLKQMYMKYEHHRKPADWKGGVIEDDLSEALLATTKHANAVGTWMSKVILTVTYHANPKWLTFSKGSKSNTLGISP